MLFNVGGFYILSQAAARLVAPRLRSLLLTTPLSQFPMTEDGMMATALREVGVLPTNVDPMISYWNFDARARKYPLLTSVPIIAAHDLPLGSFPDFRALFESFYYQPSRVIHHHQQEISKDWIRFNQTIGNGVPPRPWSRP